MSSWSISLKTLIDSSFGSWGGPRSTVSAVAYHLRAHYHPVRNTVVKPLRNVVRVITGHTGRHVAHHVGFPFVQGVLVFVFWERQASKKMVKRGVSFLFKTRSGWWYHGCVMQLEQVSDCLCDVDLLDGIDRCVNAQAAHMRSFHADQVLATRWRGSGLSLVT